MIPLFHQDTRNRFIDVPPPHVAFVYAFLQRYEGILSLRAPEPQKKEGLVTLHLMISPSFPREAEQLLRALRGQFWFTENPYGTAGTD